MIETNSLEYDKMHIPVIFQRVENLTAYEDNKIHLIISNDKLSSDSILNNSLDNGEFYSELKTYVNQVYLSQGINKEFLLQSLKGKTLCVINGGNLDRMSWNPTWYKILDKPFLGLFENIPEGYAKINLSFNEQNLVDVLKNSFKYHYDETSKQYQPYNEEEQNYQKYLYLNKYASEKTKGYEFEQIEDLKKIIFFLIKKSKINLTPEEEKIFTPLLERNVDVKELTIFLEKENRFEKLKYKKDK